MGASLSGVMIRGFGLLLFTASLYAAPPNVLLILSDDQGYHDIGVMGEKTIITPNLDRLAREGTLLTSYYAAWPACTPSRGAVLTGRYPQRNGTYENFRNDRVNDDYLYPAWEYELSPERILGMDTREILISQVLKDAGYATGVFGKWDLGSLHRFLPLQRGFDDFYGFVNTGIDYWTHERYGTPSMYRRNQPTKEDKGKYTTYLFEREALRFLDENKAQPFFAYLSFNAPHGASNLDRKIRGSAQAPAKFLEMYPDQDLLSDRRRREYLACVTAMDASIGAVLDWIDAQGKTEDTLVIFMSDNGGSSGASNYPLRGKKGQFWEGGVRVPAIVRWPGKVPAGKKNDEFLSGMELFPTILAAAELEPPDGVVYDGFDMLPVLRGEQKSPRETMFWERQEEWGARVGDWKLVHSRRGGGLYDLSEDLDENNDLSKKMPDVAKRLEAAYRGWRKEMADAEPRGPYKNY